MERNLQNDLSYLDDPIKRANQFQLLSAAGSGLNHLRIRLSAPILMSDAVKMEDKKPDNR